MTHTMRHSGLSVIGDVPWGTHFCQFYQTPQDLLDVLVGYFQRGLEDNEFCMWVTSEPLGVQEASRALGEFVPDLNARVAQGQIEILDYREWYAIGGQFDADRVLRGWVEKERQAIQRGYEGLRLTGNTFWLEKGDWKAFADYESAVDAVIGSHRMIALCTYSLDRCGSFEVLDVVRNHQFALIKQEGKWELIQSQRYRNVEKALRESEKRFAVLVKSVKDYGILMLDSEGRVASWNDGAEKIKGYRADEIVGRHFSCFYPPEDVAAGKPADQLRIAAIEDRCEDEGWRLRKDGSRFYANVVITPLRDQAGSLQGFTKVTRDITERKQMEEALRRSEQRVRLKLQSILSPEADIGNLELADILDASAVQALMDHYHELVPIPMAIIDLKGEVVVGVGWQDICTRFHRVHSESCKHCIESDTELTVGVSPGEFRLYRCKNNLWDMSTPIIIGGRHMGNLFCGQFFLDDEQVDRDLFRAQAGKYGFDEGQYLAALDRVPRLSRTYVNSGMGFFTSLAQMLSLLSYSNIKLGRLVTERDALIEERKRTEEALRAAAKDLARSNEDLEQFAYVASHDLQEPLRAVSGFVGLLKARYGAKLDERADEYITHAVDGAERMQALIGDLLSYSRVGTRGRDRERVASQCSLQKALTNLEASIRETGAEISSDDLPTIIADSAQLTQLFQNLVGNAIKFRGERPPKIRIGAKREQSAWLFSIADNGIGIAPEYDERIFMIFQRLHTRRKYPGTGIGLAICRKIVERHGGRIWVESQPDHGATFYFTIPDRGDNQ